MADCNLSRRFALFFAKCEGLRCQRINRSLWTNEKSKQKDILDVKSCLGWWDVQLLIGQLIYKLK